eukprot:660654-Amphidinium_carterae.1
MQQDTAQNRPEGNDGSEQNAAYASSRKELFSACGVSMFERPPGVLECNHCDEEHRDNAKHAAHLGLHRQRS